MRIHACNDGLSFAFLALALVALGCGDADTDGMGDADGGSGGAGDGGEETHPLNVGPDETYAFGVEEWHFDDQNSGSTLHRWLGPAGEVLILQRLTGNFGDTAYALAVDDYFDLWECCLHDGFGGSSTVREPENIDSPPDVDAAWFVWYYGDKDKTVYNTYIVDGYTVFTLEFSSEVVDMTQQQVLGILDSFRILD
jgi:hypothetical protein